MTSSTLPPMLRVCIQSEVRRLNSPSYMNSVSSCTSIKMIELVVLILLEHSMSIEIHDQILDRVLLSNIVLLVRPNVTLSLRGPPGNNSFILCRRSPCFHVIWEVSRWPNISLIPSYKHDYHNISLVTKKRINLLKNSNKFTKMSQWFYRQNMLLSWQSK